MPSKTNKKKPVAPLPIIPKELIDQMVSGPMDAEAVNAASMAFKKTLLERILGAELSHHLGSDSSPGPHRLSAEERSVVRIRRLQSYRVLGFEGLDQGQGFFLECQAVVFDLQLLL